METVYTCLCGAQERWRIRPLQIQCKGCERKYRVEEMLQPGRFNIERDERLIKEGEEPA